MISISRKTNETNIKIDINIYGSGIANISTGVAFLDHMLEQVSKHGLIDLNISCEGDTHIDDHHSVEDIGITLGQALLKALGDKKGITRYGHSFVPLDEALSRVVIDISGRSGLYYSVDFSRSHIGNFDVDLFAEFFRGFTNNAMISLHIDNLKGNNSHHQAETIFKALGRALRMALSKDEKTLTSIPSTKGLL